MAETETSATRDRDETETLTIFLETRPRRDVGTFPDRDVETETTTLFSSIGSLFHAHGAATEKALSPTCDLRSDSAHCASHLKVGQRGLPKNRTTFESL